MLPVTWRMTNLKNEDMNFPSLPLSFAELKSSAVSMAEASGLQLNEDMLRLALSCIDLTTLNPTDSVSHVAFFTQKVNFFTIEFPKLPSVAAICVYPNMASVVRENLAAEGVKVAAVAGGFPSSMTFPELKAEEARLAVLNGADEIDIVLPLWAFVEGNFDYCRREIGLIKNAIGDTHLKVILETGILGDPLKIWQASLLSLEAGADFIKTSTGKQGVSATPEAAIVMCHAIRYWYGETGQLKGFKPAGGITTPAEAMVYIMVVKEILGENWMNNNLFRIGASRLANNLLTDICGRPVSHF